VSEAPEKNSWSDRTTHITNTSIAKASANISTRNITVRIRDFRLISKSMQKAIKMNSSIFKTFFISLTVIANTHFAYCQTASILPPAKTTFVDQNGKPLTSGTVDFYTPGTTTRKTTWQDSSKSVSNTNPVVLDAAGRALIWGDGAYRQVVKDRYGNLIWDQNTSSIGSGGSGGGTIGDGLPVGTILPWSGMIAPTNYQFAYGQALSRTTYANLYQALTISTGISCVGGSPIITLTDTSNLSVGTVLESICVSGNPTVVSKTSTTVTLSANATITVSATGIFYPYGNGDGLTTFNVPDTRGFLLAGRCNMGGVNCSNLSPPYFSATAANTPSGMGAKGGNQSSLLLQSNLPNVAPTFTGNAGTATSTNSNIPVNAGTATILQGGGSPIPNVISATVIANMTSTFTPSGSISSINGGVSQTSFSNVAPTLIVNYVIKVTPDVNLNSTYGVAAVGGMTGILSCGSGIVCAGNTISAAGSSAGGSNTQVQYNNSGGFSGDPAFIWVSPKLTIGLNGTSTGQLSLAGATSGNLTQTVGTVAGTPIVTWGNGTGTPAVTATAPLVINTTTGNLTVTSSALTKTDDTNVTLTLGGSPGTALLSATSLTLGWAGTLAAARLNSNVVQAITNDTNITGSIAAQNLTLGWSGTLAAGRLNSNVVQGVTNDTNITGSVAAQNLTLGWAGTLGLTRGGTANSLVASNGGIVYSDATKLNILAGTVTAGQCLLSGSSAAPTWGSCAGGAAVSSVNTATGAITVLSEPQGRLTLTANTPVMSASATAQTTLRYDCYIGNQVPYYNGSADALDTIASCEVTDAMVSAASAGQVVSGQVYDVWWVHGGANRICLAMSSASGGGGGWASDTGGSNTARGTGYSQLDRITRGYITNKNSITNCFNGATNYGPVSANQGTYLGTVYASGNGQVSWTLGAAASGGTAALLGVWNAYSRANACTTVIDSGASYTYGSGTVRQARASAGNQITFVLGAQEDGVQFVYQSTSVIVNTAGSATNIGVGFDVTNAFSFASFAVQNAASVSAITGGGNNAGTWNAGIGLHVLAALEQSPAGTNTMNSNSNNALTACLRM